MSKFVGGKREQRFIFLPGLRDRIPQDDLVHFVLEAVERVEMGRFQVNARGSGVAQYHPRMMLALLIYCYANGIFPAAALSVPPFGRSECAAWRPIPARITQCASDRHELVTTVETIPQEVR